MSAEATFWAWRQEVKSSHKLTLLALANCHNDNTGQCNPSISYVSKTTGLNRKTVMSALSELESLKLIIPQKSLGCGNHYTLSTSTNIGTTKTSTESGTSTKIDQSQIRDTTSTENGHNQSQIRDTNLKETKKNLKYIYKDDSIPFEEFWNIYPRKTNKQKATLAWNKLKPSQDLLTIIHKNISDRLQCGEWSIDRKDFIPHASTFLNGQRWDDEIVPKSGESNAKRKSNSPVIDHDDTSWLTGSSEGQADSSTGEQDIQRASNTVHRLEASDRSRY